MAGHRDGLALIRQSLRDKTRAEGQYHPRRMQVYSWQLGVLFLGATVGCILIGMVFLVWSAVVDDFGKGRGFGDNGKVSTSVSDAVSFDVRADA